LKYYKIGSAGPPPLAHLLIKATALVIALLTSTITGSLTIGGANGRRTESCHAVRQAYRRLAIRPRARRSPARSDRLRRRSYDDQSGLFRPHADIDLQLLAWPRMASAIGADRVALAAVEDRFGGQWAVAEKSASLAVNHFTPASFTGNAPRKPSFAKVEPPHTVVGALLRTAGPDGGPRRMSRQ
jgi:hypothetical protein